VLIRLIKFNIFQFITNRADEDLFYVIG